MSCQFEKVFYNELKDKINESKLDTIKKGIATGLIGLSSLMHPIDKQAKSNKVDDKPQISQTKKKKMETVEQKVEKLIPFLKKIESNNNPNAKGDYLNGKPRSLGILQIRKGVIDDVNQHYNTNYKHKDAFDIKKAEDICKKYISLYTKNIKDPSYEILARIWNGGPKGYTRNITNEYWDKVSNEILNKK